MMKEIYSTYLIQHISHKCDRANGITGQNKALGTSRISNFSSKSTLFYVCVVSPNVVFTHSKFSLAIFYVVAFSLFPSFVIRSFCVVFNIYAKPSAAEFSIQCLCLP